MPNDPSDNSWDSHDLMPPASRANAGEPALDAVRPTVASVAPQHRPSTGANSRSIVDENRALIDISLKLRRGLTAEARADIVALIDSGAKSAAAYETLGDVETAETKLSAAVDAYKKALAIEPGRPTAETKLARTALLVIEEQRRSTIGVARAGNDAPAIPGSQIVPSSKKNTLLAVLASLVFPGLGQFVKGEYLKGGIIVGLTVVVAGVTVQPTLDALWPHLQQDFASLANPAGPMPTQPQLPLVSWLGLIVLIGAFVYSVVDAGLPRRRRGETSPAPGSEAK